MVWRMVGDLQAPATPGPLPQEAAGLAQQVSGANPGSLVSGKATHMQACAHPALRLEPSWGWAALSGQDRHRGRLRQREKGHTSAAGSKAGICWASKPGKADATSKRGRLARHAASVRQGRISCIQLPERQAPILHPVQQAKQAVLRPACGQGGGAEALQFGSAQNTGCWLE